MKKDNHSKNGENCAKASGIALPVSTKHSIEICRLIRYKNLEFAKKRLDQAIALKMPIPFKRFKKDVGHKKGPFAAGRYPVKACKAVLEILKSAEANAVAKGLNSSDLVIASIIANKGPRELRYGRIRGRIAKKTHLKLILEEKKSKKQEKVKTTKKVGREGKND